MSAQSKKTKAVELMVIDASANEAESHISSLRNAGLTIHPTVINELEDLQDALNSAEFDLILLSAKGDDFDIDGAMELCAKQASDTPIIITHRDGTPKLQKVAIRKGARDFVSKENKEHLQFVAQREFSDHRMRKDLERLKRSLAETEERCMVLIESSRDAIAYIHEGMHMLANPAYLEMFGYADLEDLEGLPILDMVSEKESQTLKRFLRTSMQKADKLEVECQRSDDSTFTATMEFSPASIDGEPCVQVLIRNFGTSQALQEKLTQLSSSDALTGLANRQYFMDELERHIATTARDKVPHALLYLNIDNFPEIRRQIGVQASDKLLRTISAEITKITGPGTLVSRFGDHTFTILHSEEVEPFARKIGELLDEQHFHAAGQWSEIKHSLGIVILDKKIPGQEFINNAYRACEEAKTSPDRNYVLFKQEEMGAGYGIGQADDEDELTKLLKFALENDRFNLVYQPIVSLQGDSRENYAVLTRLLDHNNAEIMPNDFISTAERSGLMANVDRWVIKHAIKELAKERSQGRKVNFFINLSASALQDKDLLLWVCDRLREEGAKGGWLTFQIKEADLRTHMQSAKELIEGLKRINCQLAVDQFGSAPKPESLLKHLAINYVKFDISLMHQLSSKQSQQDQLHKMNALVHSHDIQTIATGVEDANSLAILWTVGINYIQGYFLQEPTETISYEFGVI